MRKERVFHQSETKGSDNTDNNNNNIIPNLQLRLACASHTHKMDVRLPHFQMLGYPSSLGRCIDTHTLPLHGFGVFRSSLYRVVQVLLQTKCI